MKILRFRGQAKKNHEIEMQRKIFFAGNCNIKMHKKSVFSQKTKLE